MRDVPQRIRNLAHDAARVTERELAFADQSIARRLVLDHGHGVEEEKFPAPLRMEDCSRVEEWQDVRMAAPERESMSSCSVLGGPWARPSLRHPRSRPYCLQLAGRAVG